MLSRRAPLSASGRTPTHRCSDTPWTIDDVATFLSVSVPTIYQWRHRGDGPPCMRLGKHLRFDPAAVRAWAVSKAA
nr:helix-turn-helix domain-containing protein [Arsenicicoccus dermatophilus]